ncbi:MAG: pentapeptide repeat-containing protein, partial [Cyanobacteria bacterium P01_E01_bin.34]
SVLFLADLCRTDLTAASFKHANLENAYLRSADLKETDFRYANLSGADFGRAYLYNANLSFANLSSASLQGANLALARFDHAILKDITWDNGTHWYSCRGLHNVSDLPDDLSQDDDFCDALEFGKAIEIVESKQSDSKQLNRAIMICKEVARKVRERRGDSLYYHILNKFAWTCCLYNHVNMDVLSLALSATRNNKGNYLDTYAVTLIMYYGLGSYEKNDRFMEDPYSTPSQDAIDYLERALNSKDFQKLSYISSKKIIDRRMQWIEKLKSGSNPFNEQMLFTLLNEER